MHNEESEEKEIDFYSSITDLMTSLMVIFILLLVVLFNNIGEKSEKTRDRMVNELTKQINSSESSLITSQNHENNNSNNIKIINDETDPLSFIVNIDEKTGLKFESNKSIIQENSKLQLKETYNNLLNYVCASENRAQIDSIQIIGYTDSAPVLNDPQFGNLSLSQDRALSVLKFGLWQVGLDTDKGKCLKDLVSINGRGMAEQKSTMEESRRVEIKVKVKSVEQREQILKTLKKNKNKK